MSRLAVKTYCQTQLAEQLRLVLPWEVLIQRPKVIEFGERAVIIVSLPESKERRYTIPRGPGVKRVEHRVRLDVYWLASDEQQGGTDLDDLLEQIDGIFRTVTLPASLTDPQNGDTSSILFIGEEIDTTVEPPLLDESLQGLVAFSAAKTLTVIEHLTG